MKTLAPKARPLACALTLCLLVAGCQVHTAQPDRLGAAVALGYAVVASKATPAPTPSPVVGCVGGCNDTGWTGDGTVMYPCLVCNADGKKPRPRSQEAIDPSAIDPDQLTLEEVFMLVATYETSIFKTLSKLEEGTTLLEATKVWLRNKDYEEKTPELTGEEEFRRVATSSKGKQVLIVVYDNWEQLLMVPEKIERVYSVCPLESSEAWNTEQTNGERFYHKTGDKPTCYLYASDKLTPISTDQLKVEK